MGRKIGSEILNEFELYAAALIRLYLSIHYFFYYFSGLLVCFNLPGRYSGRVGSGGEPTPRYHTTFSIYSENITSPWYIVVYFNKVINLDHLKTALMFS